MSPSSTFGGPFLVNVVLTLVGVVIMGLSLKLGLGSLKKPGPGLFSFLCGFIISLQSLILIFSKRSADKTASAEAIHDGRRLLGMVGIFFSWIIFMPFLGYIPNIFLASLSFSKTLGLEGWRKPLILSIGITAFCYFLFDVYLYVDLPRGLLG
jgi:hypothetical protein